MDIEQVKAQRAYPVVRHVRRSYPESARMVAWPLARSCVKAQRAYPGSSVTYAGHILEFEQNSGLAIGQVLVLVMHPLRRGSRVNFNTRTWVFLKSHDKREISLDHLDFVFTNNKMVKVKSCYN
ncbi:hypothetical protein CEXT_274711 [Caerostris extrusa]|uniref:Uncharacterized protein n=1 Tax=Caerostris extrusa TaxID=172846 RepID=A0AAV4REW1_CAEEX|nr:hypothetical protein CEXT_274711 [Caerostris extrusa]